VLQVIIADYFAIAILLGSIIWVAARVHLESKRF